MPESDKKIVVIGVGNLLLADEGIGIHAVNELKKENFPPYVEIIDGGTAGIDLLFLLEDASYAIIIDCVEAAAEPGAILRIPVEELILQAPVQAISLHDINLVEALSLAKGLGKLPATVIFGVQPGEICFDTELTTVVSNSLPRLIQLVKKEVSRLSINFRLETI